MLRVERCDRCELKTHKPIVFSRCERQPRPDPSRLILGWLGEELDEPFIAVRFCLRWRIEANGWQFVAGTLSAEEVPISDMFIRGVKTEQGSIRSAYLLNAFYLPVADPELPVYQSTKMLVWFDCKEGNFQQRIVERYPSADGSANPVSRDTEMHDTLGIELPGADPRSVEKALLPAVCSRRRG